MLNGYLTRFLALMSKSRLVGYSGNDELVLEEVDICYK